MIGETQEARQPDVLARLKRPLRWAFIGMALALTAFATYVIVAAMARSPIARAYALLAFFVTGVALAWLAFDSTYARRNLVGSVVVLITLAMLVVAVKAPLEHLPEIVGAPGFLLGVSVSLGAWFALAAVRVDAAYARRMWAAFAALMVAVTLATFAATSSALRAEVGLIAAAMACSGASLFTLGMRTLSRRMRPGRPERRWAWCAWIFGASALVCLAPVALAFASGEPVREMYWPDSAWALMVFGGGGLLLAGCICFAFAARSTVDAIERA